MQIEEELKRTLTKQEFRDLYSKCVHVKLKKQLNVYYDEGFKLADNDITCRFRFVKNKDPLFTLKIPVSWNDFGNHKALEYEDGVKKVVGSLFPRSFSVSVLPLDMQKALEPYSISTLKRIGWMENHRYVVGIPESDINFELDHSFLKRDIELFEVESEETDPEKKIRIYNFIRQIVPNSRPSTKSKFKRFVEVVKNEKTS